jgi:N-acetylglucosaminyl-diphospho-decaprenol L-rhamnosyltransferase
MTVAPADRDQREEAAESAPQVAIAVVSWNTRDLLRRCLLSLAEDAASGRAQVWVVDNGSTDGSRAVVRTEFPWARLLEPEANLGFGAAVNLVAEQSDAPWIAPANADVALEPGALQLLVDSAADYPNAAVVAPRLVLPDGSVQHSVHGFPTVTRAVLVALRVHRLVPRLADHWCLMGQWDAAREREVDWAVGAFLLVRRVAFDAIGRFDPDQWLFAEDLDLGWRAHRAGWITRYVPRAVVRHHESAATSAAFGHSRTARTVEATYAWIARRRRRSVARSIAAVNCFAMGFEYMIFAALARASPGRFGARRDRGRFWVGVHSSGLKV